MGDSYREVLGQPSVTDPNLNEIIAKANQVPKYIEKWQNILGLQNWRIRYKFEDRLPDGENAAEVYWQLLTRRATISYLTPETVFEACQTDTKVWGDSLADYESKTVHELLHVAFSHKHDVFQSMSSAFSQEAQDIYSEQWKLAEEQIIQQLVQTLLSLERGGGDIS